MLAERFPYTPRAALPYRHPERRKKRRQSRCHTSLPRMGKGDRVSGARVLSLAAQMRRAFSYYYPSIFHTIVTLSAPAGHLPLEGKAAIREYHPLKRWHTTLVNLSAPQAPSSRAQPRDLYCTAAIGTHAPSLKRHLGASFFAFPSPTVYRFAKRLPPLRSG